MLRTWVRADNDRDGLPDDWELAHALSPSDPKDALRDTDGDGATNLQEYQSGTDPRDPRSAFRIVGCIPDANGLRVSFNAAEGRTYLIEASSSVKPNSWNVVTPALEGKGNPLEVLLTNLPPQNTIFIRVRLLP